MKQIPLSQGKIALVDDEDFERLSQFKWFAHQSRNTFYAERQIRICVGKQKAIKMHHAILGCDSSQKVDHRDGNGLNNTRENLRLATHLENVRNQKLCRDSTTGFKGVTFNKTRKKFQARIGIEGFKQSLGYYATAEEAHAAYCKAAQKHFGAFARFQ